MRIPPNPHPVIRIRNTLLTAASLIIVWMLLGLTSCTMPPASGTWQLPAALDSNT